MEKERLKPRDVKKKIILATKKVKSRVFRRIIQNCPILIIIKFQ